MTSRPGRRAGITAALALTPLAAWRFAYAYRARAGYPRQNPSTSDPAALGLAFEDVTVPSPGMGSLPGWWIPGDGSGPAPAVLLVHGWESARDRTLPNALVLHAAGFHVLTIDVRAHGANPPEELPLTAGEFGIDAAAGARYLLARADVTTVAILGHSMGAIGALLAAAAEPRIRAVVAVSTPADPYRLTRQTFHLANLPIPDVVAYPLAWLTTRVFLAPRGHDVRSVSATAAIASYAGPVLLIHGTEDRVVPFGHMARLARRARRVRAGGPVGAPIEVLSIPGGHHSWLFESPAYRAAIARFLARELGGPVEPAVAAARAIAVPAVRMPDPGPPGFSAIEGEPGGVRTLVRVLGPHG
ncbi:MAG TPA: alpha/beta fold hydrolase [Candidatus Limnocylindrales bacterium]